MQPRVSYYDDRCIVAEPFTSMTQVFDYVIVGGGTAGCVLAARLSEDRERSVCLIEAGGDGRRNSARAPAWQRVLDRVKTRRAK